MDEDTAADLHDLLADAVDAGEVPGAVAAVASGDEVHLEVVGTTELGGGEPLGPDTPFRITSMSKPIVALAALVLVDEGRLALDEPVGRLLPELSSPTVLVRPDGPLDEVVAADRPITLEDLLTFRLGLGTPAADTSKWPVFREAERLGLCFGPPLPRPELGVDEWLARFATLPLLAQPGTAWRYDLSASVLGVLVARAGGASLAEVLASCVLEPLGMVRTAWHLPGAAAEALPAAYRPADGGGLVCIDPAGAASEWATPPTFEDGASGLVSTVGDLVRFGQALLGGGAGLVTPELLGRMTTDRLTPAQRHDPMAAPFLDGGGWGYGVGVDPQGRYGWAGGFGTVWRNDPAAGRTDVLLTQRAVFPAPLDLFDRFLTVVGPLGPRR